MSVNVVIKSVFDNKGIQQAQRQFAAIGKDIGKLAVGIGTGLTIGAVATTKFAASAIKAAEGVEQANNRLAAVNESMGLFGSETSQVTQRLIKFAEANELNVAVDAEVIKATQAKLLTFKELASTADDTGGAFDRATMAALDLAAAGFGTAETNAIQLGKALQDPVKGLSALRRSGITFTEQEKEKIKTLVESNKTLEAQDLILQAIETQVGGTAEATAKSSDKIKLAFDNVLEGVGGALLPAFDDFATSLNEDVVPLLTELGEDIAPILVDSFRLLIEVIKEATDENTPLGQSLGGVRESFTLLFDTLSGGKSDLEATTSTLTLLADALNFVLVTGAGLVAFFQGVGVAAKAFAEGDLKTYFDFLFTDPIVFMENQNRIRNGLGQTDEAFKNTAESARNLNNVTLDKLRGQMGDTRIQADKLLEAQRELAFYMAGGKPGTYKPFVPKKDVVETTTTTTKNTTKKEVETTKERFAAVQKVIKDAQKKIAAAEKAYAKTRVELNRDALDDIKQLELDAFKAQQDLIKESRQRLTGAFAAATRLSLGDLFNRTTTTEIETQVKRLSSTLTLSVSRETEKVAFSSVSNIIEGLSKRLAESRRLLTNASQLASEGFSQTFIEQVIETGAETGNALADAILGATPESKAEMKRLFGELETVSDTGMDKIAEGIVEKFGLATHAMRVQSDVIDQELTAAVAARGALLAISLANAASEFSTAIQEISSEFEEALLAFDKRFAGLGSTIDALLAKMKELQAGATGDVQAAITAPTSGTMLASATVTQNVAIKEIGKATGIVIDSMADVAGTVAYIQARIAAANTYIRSSSSNAIQEASARNQIAGFTAELANLRGAAATGAAAGTVININVKADTTQSQAMVGKTIGNIVTKYVTTGGQVLVSGNN